MTRPGPTVGPLADTEHAHAPQTRGRAVPSAGAGPSVRLLEGGEAFFHRFFARVDRARRSILLRCFDWRDDETGALVARRLMAAADRGVRVAVLKDLVGATYEYYEGSQQSFLHKTPDWRTRLAAASLTAIYSRPAWPRVRANPLAAAFAAHPNITIEGGRRRYDHSKVYLVDDEVLFVGGIGVGDDARLDNIDFMLEIEGRNEIERYHARAEGRVPFEPGRQFDFLLHTVGVHGRQCPLLAERLQLIGAARTRITIEMAYLSDRRSTAALAAAVRRGVSVTLVTGARTNIIPELHLATCDALLRETGAPPHLRVVLHHRPVHSKVIVIDGRVVDLGSTNFTEISHGAYDEVDVYVQDETLAACVEAAIERHAAEGRTIGPRVPYSRWRAAIEAAIAVRHARPKTT